MLRYLSVYKAFHLFICPDPKDIVEFPFPLSICSGWMQLATSSRALMRLLC